MQIMLFSKTGFCSATFSFVQQFFALFRFLFSKTHFCSAKSILFSKLVFVQQVVQQEFARHRFLFSKILLCSGFCSATSKYLFSKYVFCSAKSSLFSKNLLFVQQVQKLFINLFCSAIICIGEGGATVSSPCPLRN